jgi:hypothetical protein
MDIKKEAKHSKKGILRCVCCYCYENVNNFLLFFIPTTLTEHSFLAGKKLNFGKINAIILFFTFA